MPGPSPSLFFHPSNIFGEYRSLSTSYPLLSYLVPLRPKYLPQHPIL
jgi:hypothetical protein